MDRFQQQFDEEAMEAGHARHEKWLAGLTNGDEVAVRTTTGLGFDAGVEIHRVTKAQKKFLFVGHIKFRRLDGYEVRKPGADRWTRRAHLAEATDEVKGRIAAAAERRRADGLLHTVRNQLEHYTLPELQALNEKLAHLVVTTDQRKRKP